MHMYNNEETALTYVMNILKKSWEIEVKSKQQNVFLK